MPASLTPRSVSCAFGTSTSGSQALNPGCAIWISAVMLKTCSCMSTVPSSAVSSGPPSVSIVAMRRKLRRYFQARLLLLGDRVEVLDGEHGLHRRDRHRELREVGLAGG